MPPLKLTFVAVALLSLVGTSAFANQYTNVATYNAATDYGDTSAGQSPITLTVGGFGLPANQNRVLTGVRLQLNAEGSGGAKLMNNSDDLQEFTFAVTTTVSVRNAPGTNVAGLSGLTNAFTASQDFSIEGGQTDFFGGNSSDAKVISPTDLSPFFAPSLNFNLQALSRQTSGGGDSIIVSDLSNFARGTLFVSYIFDDVPPSTVPEPASMALLGAGLAGIGLLRRKPA